MVEWTIIGSLVVSSGRYQVPLNKSWNINICRPDSVVAMKWSRRLSFISFSGTVMSQVFESDAKIGRCSGWLMRTMLLGPIGSTSIWHKASRVDCRAANVEWLARVVFMRTCTLLFHLFFGQDLCYRTFVLITIGGCHGLSFDKKLNVYDRSI